MRKYIAMLALTAMSCLPLAAQSSVFNNPDNKPYFGIRIGADVTCPGDVSADNVGVDIYKNGGGIEFGAIYNLPMVANLYLEPGLKLYYDTYSMKDEFIEAIDENVSSVSIRKFGLRIPLMVGYHFDFTKDIKVSVFTGPELEVGFSAKEKVKGYGVESSESIYGDDGGMKRVDLLWGIGAGISYQHFYFGVGGGIGMLNMLSDSDASFHENRVTFSLGYNF